MKKNLIYIISFIRICFFRLKGSKIHPTTRILRGVVINRSIVGKYCYIGLNSALNDSVIGNYCSIANNVTIGGMEHSYWSFSTSTHISDKCIMGKKTKIGNDVWIASNCIIKQGISIGDGAVIGAGSVVTKDVPENTIYVGIPAKFLKQRLNKQVWTQIKNTKYWNLKPKVAKSVLDKIN